MASTTDLMEPDEEDIDDAMVPDVELPVDPTTVVLANGVTVTVDEADVDASEVPDYKFPASKSREKIIKERIQKQKAEFPVKAKPEVKQEVKPKKELKPVEAKPVKVEETNGESKRPVKHRDKFNEKELKIMQLLGKHAAPMSLDELSAEAWPNKSKSQANSWVRNSLRRPVATNKIKQIARGTYELVMEDDK